MEFKGTKGKWLHTKCYDHHIEVNGKVLITIHCLESGKPKYDGRLISKAPEMLEMLKDILSGMKGENFEVSQNEIEKLINEATNV